MAIIVLLVIIFAVIVGVSAGLTLMSGAGSISARRDPTIQGLKSELCATKARENVATKALRAIANGAGSPVFEASDALDQIEVLETKELS